MGNTGYLIINAFFPKSLSVRQKKEENKKEKKAGFIHSEHLFLVRFTMINKYAPILHWNIFYRTMPVAFSKTTCENMAVSVLAGRCEQKPRPTKNG